MERVINQLAAGDFTTAIYTEDCLFEDPTIKFRGTCNEHLASSNQAEQNRYSISLFERG
jgi:hypothetical protein